MKFSLYPGMFPASERLRNEYIYFYLCRHGNSCILGKYFLVLAPNADVSR